MVFGVPGRDSYTGSVVIVSVRLRPIFGISGKESSLEGSMKVGKLACRSIGVFSPVFFAAFACALSLSLSSFAMALFTLTETILINLLLIFLEQ
jgi:hypothetical protein